MKQFLQSFSVFAFFIAVSFGCLENSHAQFSQAVIVLKGTVHTEEGSSLVASKPIAVKVSVRAVGDTATGITRSRSNFETGKYLVVLKPGKKYWFHFEGDNIVTKDTMVITPDAQQTLQVSEDVTVVAHEIDAHASANTSDAKMPTN